MAINSDVEDLGGDGSHDAGERAWLLQSPSVDSVRGLKSDGEGSGGVSCLGAVFIVVNAALGAGLLNFPAAFYMAGGVLSGVMLQMVRELSPDMFRAESIFNNIMCNMIKCAANQK